MKKILALSVALIMMLALLTSCGGRDIDEDLVGTWYMYTEAFYVLNDDGTGTVFMLGEIEWWVRGGNFFVKLPNLPATEYTYTLEDGTLTLVGVVGNDEHVLTSEPTEFDFGFEIPGLDDLNTPDFGAPGDLIDLPEVPGDDEHNDDNGDED